MKLYKYTSADFGLDVLKTGRIKVARLLDVNDPNEWIPVCPNPNNNGIDYHSDPKFRTAFRHFWSCQYGFISFSLSWDNPVLWGHYADRFRGVALVFEVCNPSKVKEVKYCDARYVLDEKEMYSGDREKVDRLISRKAKEWEHEQEYRALVDLRACTTQHHGNDTLFFANIKDNGCLRLCGIYMGPECTATVYDVHSALDKKPPIGFESVQLAPDSRTYGIIKCDSKVWDGTDWASTNEI